MLKKLLLFAILSPLALQPVMQANFLTRAGELATKAGSASLYGAKNIAMPWVLDKKAPFHSKLDIVSTTLTLFKMIYGFNSIYSNKAIFNAAPQDDPWVKAFKYITKWLPKVLVVNDTYRMVTRFTQDPDHRIDQGLTLVRILMNLTKLPEKEAIKNANRAIGLWER